MGDIKLLHNNQYRINSKEYIKRDTEIKNKYNKDLVAVFERMVETGELQKFCKKFNYDSPSIAKKLFEGILLKIKSIFY